MAISQGSLGLANKVMTLVPPPYISYLPLPFYFFLFIYNLSILNMISTTVFTFLFSRLVLAQNGAWVPEPLPAITPPDVVNLLIQDAADGAGDFVASVIGAVHHFICMRRRNSDDFRIPPRQHIL